MVQRNSSRDTWKLAHWEEYMRTVDFSIPRALDDPDVRDDLLVFHNSNDVEYRSSMERILNILEEET